MNTKLQKIIRESIKYSDSKGDKKDFYNLVEYAVKTPKLNNQPPFLEIGTRRGGSALALAKIVKEFFNTNTVLITVDPYGDKSYDNKPWKYGNEFYIQMRKILAPYGNHIHYHMTSENFISILDKINYWFKGKKKDFSKFSFIFLDGSHLPEVVLFEYKKLFPKLIKNGYMIIDNTDFYNKKVQKYFENNPDSSMEIVSTKDQTIVKKLK